MKQRMSSEFIYQLFAMILIIALFPEFTLWLPKIMGYIN